MSLISRIEVTNYLTEAINPHRRLAEWRPMLTGITLRMDCQSALVNITNGAGKTSLTDLMLYLLSRDGALLKRIRDKCAPKGRGYTHARIEFRTGADDSFQERSLLEIDPANLPGETHVVGVALNDDADEPPLFYTYSGTLEDSPCYVRAPAAITSVADAEFVAKTKGLRSCKWNRHSTRREWEDLIGLFISADVVRRNVKYQLEGSDDKNASFFAVKEKPGESYQAAFFRAVVAPDLLSNLLSTWSEENEQTVEDTLHLTLSQIVSTDRALAKQEKRLVQRQARLAELKPLLDAGTRATEAQKALEECLQALRKDAALLDYFGHQGSVGVLHGLPRPISSLKREVGQDPRVVQALKGMVLSADHPLLMLDSALAALTGVEAAQLRQLVERNGLRSLFPHSQVLDFNCFPVIPRSGNQGGGNVRRGYPRETVLALPNLLRGYSSARLEGLAAALELAFDIAETQIDTNPAALELRTLQRQLQDATRDAERGAKEADALQGELTSLERQRSQREENQAAWEDFQHAAAELPELPEPLHTQPALAHTWLQERASELQEQRIERELRQQRLQNDWTNYSTVLASAGLGGIAWVRERVRELQSRAKTFATVAADIKQKMPPAKTGLTTAEDAAGAARRASEVADSALRKFEQHQDGFRLFVEVFGDVDPAGMDPIKALKLASDALARHRQDLKAIADQISDLETLQARAARFSTIFGEGADPQKVDPKSEERRWHDAEKLAGESRGPLIEKVEALDQFEELFPETRPSDWLAHADSRYAELGEAIAAQESQRDAAQAEIAAIEQMSVVVDGAFAAAWRILEQENAQCSRLHTIIVDSALSEAAKTAAMSALSGMLAAPVFKDHSALASAAAALNAAGVAVPLLQEEALLAALLEQSTRVGDVYQVAFVAGAYSRQVRILLEPSYAQAEIARLQAEAAICKQTGAKLTVERAPFAPRSETYRLAEKADDAVSLNARELHQRYTSDLEEARAKLVALSPQLTDDALDVLQGAREFARAGGADFIAEVRERHRRKREEERNTFEPAFDDATAKATQENIAALAAARQYVGAGGAAAHQVAAESAARCAKELEQADERLRLAKCVLQEIEELQARNTADEEAFVSEGLRDELGRLERAIAMDARDDDRAFMVGFARISAAAKLVQERIGKALRVSFERAQTYRHLMDESEDALALKIASIAAAYEAKKVATVAAEQRARRLREAEIPQCERSRVAIHELAFETSTRASKLRAAGADIEALEVGSAVAEAHPMYDALADVARYLQQGPLESATREKVLEAAISIRGIDLGELLRKHSEASQRRTDANKAFLDVKSTYCTRAREQSSASETALNTLEIEEIERASPQRLEALVQLFSQLQQTIEQDREAARESSRIAEKAHDAALEQLGRLLRLAETNLETLDRVMKRYPRGRFFVKAGIVAEDRIKELLLELKQEVERVQRDEEAYARLIGRGAQTRLKNLLRDTLIARIFVDPEVEFTNAGIWGGACKPITQQMSTGQKVALEFMWIVRQAEFEIERGLSDLTRAQAAKSRTQNRMIFVDGIFSSLSDRKLIKEAMNGLRDLGGNFQIIGLLHSANWVNDYGVFPVYHVGKKLEHSTGKGLVTFSAGRDEGSIALFSSFAQPLIKTQPGASA